MLENSLSTSSEVNLESNLLSILLIKVKTNREDTNRYYYDFGIQFHFIF